MCGCEADMYNVSTQYQELAQVCDQFEINNNVWFDIVSGLCSRLSVWFDSVLVGKQCCDGSG